MDWITAFHLPSAHDVLRLRPQYVGLRIIDTEAEALMKKPIGWARVKGPEELAVRSPDQSIASLRRGAWYPVVQDDASPTVVLGVSRAEVAVQRDALQIRRHQSERFSVVARAPGDPNPARGTAADVGPTYAVCPATRSRVRLTEHADSIECPRCAGVHMVAWDQLC